MLKIIATPEMKQKLIEQGADPANYSPDEFAGFIKSEITKWAAVVKASGATAE